MIYPEVIKQGSGHVHDITDSLRWCSHFPIQPISQQKRSWNGGNPIAGWINRKIPSRNGWLGVPPFHETYGTCDAMGSTPPYLQSSHKRRSQWCQWPPLAGPGAKFSSQAGDSWGCQQRFNDKYWCLTIIEHVWLSWNGGSTILLTMPNGV